MISPPCAVVLLRFPSLVVKVPVALLGNGVTVTLTDMELFSSRTVELSAVAQATTTPEDMRGIIPSPSNGTANEGATGGLGRGVSPRMMKDGPADSMMVPPHGVWSQKDAALKALRLPGHVRLLWAQK